MVMALGEQLRAPTPQGEVSGPAKACGCEEEEKEGMGLTTARISEERLTWLCRPHSQRTGETSGVIFCSLPALESPEDPRLLT